jgi:hypothetical protein
VKRTNPMTEQKMVRFTHPTRLLLSGFLPFWQEVPGTTPTSTTFDCQFGKSRAPAPLDAVTPTSSLIRHNYQEQNELCRAIATK